jgi:hypothetical protein
LSTAALLQRVQLLLTNCERLRCDMILTSTCPGLHPGLQRQQYFHHQSQFPRAPEAPGARIARYVAARHALIIIVRCLVSCHLASLQHRQHVTAPTKSTIAPIIRNSKIKPTVPPLLLPPYSGLPPPYGRAVGAIENGTQCAALSSCMAFCFLIQGALSRAIIVICMYSG